MIALEQTENEKVLKQNSVSGVNAWTFADNILLEVCMVQNVQKVFLDDVAELSFAEEQKENTLLRLAMLNFAGEAILRHVEEIREGLTALLPLIRALQTDIK